VEAYTDGVWLVELAALSDPALIPQAVTSALGIREEPGRSLSQTLVDFLQPRNVLLLLDNCEHLLSACVPLVDEWLKTCPHLRLLATSREALGLTGEQTYRVPSLAFPDLDRLPKKGKELASRVAPYDACRLFVERASLHMPGFGLTDHNAAAVAAICSRLDGIPLALELAAARVRAMPVEQIAARLEDRFRLLTGGNKTSLPRHQTLRSLIDWSYALLNASEQALLGRLSVFAGGWTLEAAEAVCTNADIGVDQALDLLIALVDKSLVVYEQENGQARYRLLETIRQYAAEKRIQFGDGDLWNRGHAEYFLRMVQEARAKLNGPAQTEALNLLDIERPNLRAALAFCLERSVGSDPADPLREQAREQSLRLTAALQEYWKRRGYLTEGREYFTAVLSESDSESLAALRADALLGAGALAWRQGDFPAAQGYYQESLDLYRMLQDQRGAGMALGNLGVIAEQKGDHVAARAFYEEALFIFQELGMNRAVAIAFNNLGIIANKQGDYATTHSYYEQAFAIHRGLDDKAGMAMCLDNLGLVTRYQGDYSQARAYFEESLAISREIGDRHGEATSLSNLGSLACQQEDHAASRTYLTESLVLRRDMGDKPGLIHVLDGFASLACKQEQAERAARLDAASAALKETLDYQDPPNEQENFSQRRSDLQALLGPSLYRTVTPSGRSMSLDEALDYALQPASSDPTILSP